MPTRLQRVAGPIRDEHGRPVREHLTINGMRAERRNDPRSPQLTVVARLDHARIRACNGSGCGVKRRGVTSSHQVPIASASRTATPRDPADRHMTLLTVPRIAVGGSRTLGTGPALRSHP